MAFVNMLSFMTAYMHHFIATIHQEIAHKMMNDLNNENLVKLYDVVHIAKRQNLSYNGKSSCLGIQVLTTQRVVE